MSDFKDLGELSLDVVRLRPCETPIDNKGNTANLGPALRRGDGLNIEFCYHCPPPSLVGEGARRAGEGR